MNRITRIMRSFICLCGGLIVSTFTLLAEDLYRVEVNGKWGFINNKGKMVIKPQYDECYNQFSEGVASVQKNGKWGCINTKNELIIPHIYKSISYIKDGRIPVSDKQKWALLDLQGKTIIPPTKGLRENSICEGYVTFLKDGKEGFMDLNGQVVIAPIYDEVSKFSNGLSGVTLGEKSGFIDTKGKWVVELDQALVHPYAGFSEGLAPVYDKKSKRYGYIDRKGNWIIKPQFRLALKFNGGLAVVSALVIDKEGWVDSFKGAINRKGEFVVKPKYTVLWDFEEGMARACDHEGEECFVSSDGKELRVKDCRNAQSFHKGLAFVEIGGYDEKTSYAGYINKMGEWIWRPKDFQKKMEAYRKEKAVEESVEQKNKHSVAGCVNQEITKPALHIITDGKVALTGKDAGKLKIRVLNTLGSKIFLNNKSLDPFYYDLKYRFVGSRWGGLYDERGWSGHFTVPSLESFDLFYACRPIKNNEGKWTYLGAYARHYEITLNDKLLKNEGKGTVTLNLSGYLLKTGEKFSIEVKINMKLVKPKVNVQSK